MQERYLQDFETTLPIISVIVCTHNRVDLLVDVLRTLCEQTLAAFHYEVVVVDNNSVDNTRRATEEFCCRYPNVRYCLETQQGLSHARNLGWREAQGMYVAYIDDDCKVPEQWLSIAKDIIKRVFPGVFGGPFYAFFNTPKPRWYKDSYGSHEPFKEARILNEKECVNIFGGNMFFCRTLLEKLNGFDTGLGMSGKKIAYGEETALLKHISVTMPDQLFYYDPALYVYHLVQAKKMTMLRIMRERFVRGGYTYRVLHDDIPSIVSQFYLLKQAATILFAFTSDFMRGVFKRNHRQYPYFQNYLYEHTFQHLKRLGKIYEIYLHDKQQA